MKNFVHFPSDEDEQLHTFYRALDYLCRAKKQIEREDKGGNNTGW